MTPTPQDHHPRLASGEMSGLNSESIVVSGISGIFPQSHSVKEFSDLLYDKINPVLPGFKPFNWTHPEASEYMGTAPDMDRFDSRFFMVHHHLAKCMDPMARKALEHAFQAIYDAGMSPKQLNGKKVGVYIGAALSDTEKFGFIDTMSKTGFGITGCSKTMYANRISYWLNAKGPSMTIDDACCGFSVALEEAYTAMREGICEAAIVGGANLCTFPQSQVHYSRCIKVSPDEKTKSFDQNANGCTKSGAVSIIFLQKAKDALRAYAEVVHVKTEFISRLSDETGQVFGFVRDPNITAQFLKQIYEESKMSPREVEYIEAFGSATPEADKAELEAIEKVFCDNRRDPLYVGSVISNIGYTEAASGGTALTKVLLGYHKGMLASNLHCETPRQDVAAIRDGRMCVLRDHLPFRGSLTAVNCLSVTGVNSHVLLRGCAKEKDLSRYKASIPRLVTVSARQEEYIASIFEDLKSRPIDPEEHALFHNIHSTNISGHLGRGYIILDTNEEGTTVSLGQESKHCDDSQRPLWFVYSGMGSQWAGMGAQLMRIPIFAAAIERCRKALEPKGIDLVHIITSPDKNAFDNILNSFVGIAAIQIGLTDVLLAMGIRPDKIIGHSAGELGCAYADGCLSTEEMILSAYSRGMVSNETPLIKGAMAAVGLGYSQISKKCPPEIEVACHNGSESCTISGPEEKLREFVASLTASGIFAREVPCSNIAYHSRYIADAGPNLLRRCSEIISEPRARSERWVSTSIPEDRWDEPLAKYCSAEYLNNNLLSPVLFEETCRLIPNNAVLIEIAPHGLLQAILRRSLPPSCTNLPLTQRGHKDNVVFLLENIGKLYVSGYTPKISAIYPKIDFPVSRGTPHLSHLVKWMHDEVWEFGASDNTVAVASICNFLITTHDDEHLYLNGNVFNGKVLYPYAAALVAVWDTLAMSIGVPKKNISVRFNDIYLYTQPILHGQKSMKLDVWLQKGSGEFEVLEGDSKIATGNIVAIKKVSSNNLLESDGPLKVSSDEVYEYFNDRGYSYRDDFRSIHSVDESLSKARIVWKNNWVTLINGLLQLNVLRHAHEGITLPCQIRELVINTRFDMEPTVYTEIDDIIDCTRSGPVTINNIKFRKVPVLGQNGMSLIPMLPGNGKASKTSSENSKKHFALNIKNVGNLDTLYWEEVSTDGRGIEIMVEYAGFNVSDLNQAMKGDDDKKKYGMDFSGLSKSGERVMGICPEGSARSVVVARSDLVWPVPAHWSLEDAATVPLAYLQAYYCLCIKGGMIPGMRVLIHGGAGALGQAAISIALARGCQVFTTVANSSKKRHLLKLFPQLNDNAIGCSREDSFGDMILYYTNGEGCDIVISCVKDNVLKNVSMKCVAHYGITIDTVQIVNHEKFEYGMSNMTRSRSYTAVDFNSIFDGNSTDLQRKLHDLVSEGIVSGEVRPLSRVQYSAREAARAFRLLAASQHRGRVLLRLTDHDSVPQHRIVCTSENSHLIIWDGDSYGLQLAGRLISQGVKKLRIQCLGSRSYSQIMMRHWSNMGIVVQMRSDVVDSKDKISSLIKATSQLGPIEGIYIISSAAKDNTSQVNSIIEELDSVSRKSCPLLKYFGLISVDYSIGHETSISRSKDGYPVTSLTLPAFKKSTLTKSLWIRSALDVTEQALRGGYPIQVARPQVVMAPSLAKMLKEFAGTEREDQTLRELDLTPILPSIKSFLSDVYQASFNDDYLLDLTIKSIREIENKSSESKLEDVKGLHSFFPNILDHDEIYATADFIPLDTLVHEVKSMQDPMDPSQSYLFVVPGLEGHHARFRTLCAHLKLPALVLQPGLDRPADTPRELAARYSEILLEKVKLQKHFYMLAYECGIFVALELASILENKGLTGTIFCMGDGPEEMKGLLEEELSSFSSEEELQDGVVTHMVSLMRGAAAEARRGGPWSARLDAAVRALLGRVPHTAQYVRALLEAAYARICTMRTYNPEPRKLKSRIILMRVPHGTESQQNSLQRYTDSPIKIHDLAAPFVHAAEDLRAPAVINSYLDNEIIEAYKNSNFMR